MTSLKATCTFYFLTPKKLVRLFILKEVKPSPDSWMIKVLHLVTCSRHYDILAKTRRRMTTAIMFSRQNDTGSGVSNTLYWQNLVLVVLLVLESEALYQVGIEWFYWPFSRRSLDSTTLHYGTVWGYHRASFFNGYYEVVQQTRWSSSLNFFGN